MNKTIFIESHRAKEDVEKFQNAGLEIVSVSGIQTNSVCIVYRDPKPSKEVAKLQSRVDSLLIENDELLNTIDDHKLANENLQKEIRKLKRDDRDTQDVFF